MTEASPLTSVTAVALENVADGPVAGAVNVTVAPAALTNWTVSGTRNREPASVDCGLPAHTTRLVGGPVLSRKKVAWAKAEVRLLPTRMASALALIEYNPGVVFAIALKRT